MAEIELPLGLRCPEHDTPDNPVVLTTQFYCPAGEHHVPTNTAKAPHLHQQDPPLLCAYHPPEQKGVRCGRPTTQMMIGGGLDGMWFLAICPECATQAALEGISFIFAHRFGTQDDDLPLGND